ncbi:permease [Acuticoccus sp. M5D2P5]|uniref:permease n=1 Tax=Acuticoccus kalidii TaxID=2910977 RepID=UPI001F2214DB|nr:permease [Acuticoccus kalidii]MCF3934515.1 permease [Acuticoccus kalidii]
MTREPDAPASVERPTRKRRLVDVTVAVFGVAALIAGYFNWRLGGTAAVADGAEEAVFSLVSVLPQLVLGIVVAGLAQVVIPRDRIGKMLGEQSGIRGLLIATGIGALMPGGPFASFPLIYALAHAGADVGALVAFLVGWAAIGVHRLLVWEIPFMGAEFGIVRFLSSLPLPIIAGLLARWLINTFPRLRNPF